MKPLSLMDVLVPFAPKDDWIFNAPFVPAPKEQAWASENGVKFHIETALSNNKAGQEFTALCGVKGDYLHQRGASQNFMRCEKCFQLSSVTGIDVAETMACGQAENAGSSPASLPSGKESSSGRTSAVIIEITSQGRSNTELTESTTVGDEGVSEIVKVPQGDALSPVGRSENSSSHADSQNLPVHPRSGDTRAEETSCSASALQVSCHRVSGLTLYERVTARLADAAFIRSAQFWGKVISKCEDVSLEEGYRLEDLDAERESLGVR